VDIATLVGLITCGVMVFLGIVTGPEKMAGFRHFYDLTSIFITLGGSISCMIIQSKSFGKFIEDIKSIRLAMKVQQAHEAEVIRNIINLSNVARKEGLLALEEAANNIEDDFLKKGIMLIVDGSAVLWRLNWERSTQDIMKRLISGQTGREWVLLGV
jgi:chemotaxis protein MotA